MAHYPHREDSATLQEQVEFEFRQARHTQTDTNRREQNSNVDVQKPKPVADGGKGSPQKDSSNDFEKIDRGDVDAFQEEIEFESVKAAKGIGTGFAIETLVQGS
jgi:hypothetical protein